MLKVKIDYEECNGCGACVEACPVEILEISEDGRWCKPIGGEVKNQESLEQYHDKIKGKSEPIDVTIEYVLPECFECYSCESSCENDAISVGPKIGFEDLDVDHDEEVNKYRAQLHGE